ncbi:arylsulfatase A-like enzyme [Kribbella steppae]|uniref:Arylsulfatase A-like enzyme n=1 Tax=Kribbella steppae TaxID=2512223 RepID=A0A4R2HMM6_9ACTN|nr:sulfatase-like hydrolase/transferase [Kribbella steppae]TCO32444.1 arylsulfatase A-like enzyme [Kribbella steppae]
MSPNVVVFLTDQQRWDTTGLHGNPVGLTPNLDRVGRAGTHFANSFTCQPLCTPARATLQTGLYPTTAGPYRNGIPLPEDARTLAHHFGAAGYETAYVGKWHLGDSASRGPVAPAQRGGYEYWLAANALEHTSDSYNTIVYDDTGAQVKLPGYRVDALTDAAMRYVAKPKDRPFFLFLSLLEPHHQNRRDDYPAPEGYEEAYRGAWTPPDLATLGGTSYRQLPGYYGMIKRIDEAYGRLLDTLTSLGLRDDTIVLFTSDHGNHFKTRNSEYKRSVHDASIRVPTVATGGIFTGGGQVNQLLSHVDLAPTLLDAAGLPVPKEMQGRSVVPLLHDRKAAWGDDVFVQVSESETARAVRTQRWKYGVVAPDCDPAAAGADHYVETYLFDLMADPYELDNLIGYRSHTHVAARLRERLISRMIDAGEASPTIAVSPERDSGQLHIEPAEAEL